MRESLLQGGVHLVPTRHVSLMGYHCTQLIQAFSWEETQVLTRGDERLMAGDDGTHAYRDADALVVVDATNSDRVYREPTC